MNKKELTEKELIRLKLLQEKKNEEFLKKFILDQTEAQVKNKFSDENLDKELEKQKLLESITNFWKIRDVASYLFKAPKEHEAIFPQEFYQQIFRLNNWEYEGKISHKPPIVGKFTDEIIYYRFSQEILPILKIINPFILPGKRKYKHHQYLTPGGRMDLKRFIAEAIHVMKTCSDWNEFRIKYCKKYNVPYQLKLFLPNKK